MRVDALPRLAATKSAVVGGTLTADAVEIPRQTGGILYAIVTRSMATKTSKRLILICGKDAPGDLWRRCGDALAREGFIVVRFDPAGLVDEPDPNEPVGVPIQAYFRRVHDGAHTPSNIDAIVWARRAFPSHEIFLLTPCGACASLLLAASARPDDVAGLVLVTPAVLYSDKGSSITSCDAALAASGYRRRLRNPAAYLNFLSGHSDYRLIRTLATRWLRDRVCRVRDALNTKEAVRPRHPAFNPHFWEGFQGVMANRLPVLVLLADSDYHAAQFNAEFKDVVLDRRPEWANLCTTITLAGTDHNFTFEDGRKRLVAAIANWLRPQSMSAVEHELLRHAR